MISRAAVQAVLALGLLAVSLAAEAQQDRVYRVGVILQGGPYVDTVNGLRDGLRELGLEEGKQLVLDIRDTKSNLKAVEAAARSLEAQKVDVIYAVGTSTTLAVKRATTRVPIVFYAGTDPVGVGLVQSFREPGGRLTGIHGQMTDLTAKRVEILKEMIPKLRRVVTFYNPDNPVAQLSLKFAREATRQLKMELVEHKVTSVEELRAGLDALRPREADAFVLVSDGMVISQTDLVVKVTNAKRLPAILSYSAAVTKGALASYGESNYTLGRFSAKHVQRVLLGADPGTLPVEQLNRPQFVVSLKAAKALGLTIPPSVLLRADQVIE